MKKTLIILLLPAISFAQQESKIKVDSSNKNAIEVTQQGKDTLQSSDISLIKADSNKIFVKQETNSKPDSGTEYDLKFWTKSIGDIFAVLISIATFVGLAWQGYKHLRDNKKK
ncbi:MAG: hypothetical protein ACJAVW_002644 [Spirosomataceae bacterium]|jgi:hypothetical protein